MTGIIELLKILLPILLPLIGDCYAGMDEDGRAALSKNLKNPRNCLRFASLFIQTMAARDDNAALDPQVQELLDGIKAELQ